MQLAHSEAQQPNSVMATFEDGLSTFLMAYDATLEDLAGRLDQLAEAHHGKPIAINVRLGSRR